MIDILAVNNIKMEMLFGNAADELDARKELARKTLKQVSLSFSLRRQFKNVIVISGRVTCNVKYICVMGILLQVFDLRKDVAQ